jgi:hypothetical protein
MFCSFKNLDDGQSKKQNKKKTVKFSHAPFSLLSTHENLAM